MIKEENAPIATNPAHAMRSDAPRSCRMRRAANPSGIRIADASSHVTTQRRGSEAARQRGQQPQCDVAVKEQNEEIATQHGVLNEPTRRAGSNEGRRVEM
jgi:hypothetical protein